MDRIDRKILDILQKDARAPLKEIADRVFLSSPAVSARMARLESSGAIMSYQAQVAAPMLGYMVKAFVNLDMDPQRKPEFYPYIESCPHVVECNCVTGDYSMLIEVLFATTQELDQFINHLQQHANRVLHTRGAPRRARQCGGRCRRSSEITAVLVGVLAFQPHGYAQGFVHAAHVILGDAARALPQAALIQGTDLLGQNNAVLGQAAAVGPHADMRRQAVFILPAGDGRRDHSGAVPVADLILDDKYRPYPALLAAHDGA